MFFSPSQFRDVVSGRRRGVGAGVLRAALRAAEVPYTWAVCRRNGRYDSGRARIERVGVPVVSVGNLTLGGTGKTPLVEWLARWFLDRGIAPGIVSRGYGARPGEPNDEARELAMKLPGVPHVQDPDRVAAARRAIEEFHCQAIILDDAFQHRRIGRDLDIVLLDALEPFGFGHVFPRGTLREPLEGLARADVVALSRANMLADLGRVFNPSPEPRETAFCPNTDGLETHPTTAAEIRHQAMRYAPRAVWLELRHAPRGLVAVGGAEELLGALAGQSVAAFCGIGNPAAFRHTLAECGYRIAGFREFPDHHAYGPRDIKSLAAWAAGLDVKAVVCTQKDLVKLSIARLGSRPLWAVAVGLEMLSGQAGLEDRLAALIAV